MTGLFGEKTRDCGQTPVLVRLVKLGSGDAGIVQGTTKRLETGSITNAKVDV